MNEWFNETHATNSQLKATSVKWLGL